MKFSQAFRVSVANTESLAKFNSINKMTKQTQTETTVTFENYWDATEVEWTCLASMPTFREPFNKEKFLNKNGTLDISGWRHHVDYLHRRFYERSYFELRDKWITEYLSLGEHKYSPYASSGSEYVLDRKNGIIYRFSDHWGDVASCKWTIKPNEEFGFRIAMAKLEDFRRISPVD